MRVRYLGKENRCGSDIWENRCGSDIWERKIDAVQKIGPGYSYEKGGHFSVKKRGWTEYH